MVQHTYQLISHVDDHPLGTLLSARHRPTGQPVLVLARSSSVEDAGYPGPHPGGIPRHPRVLAPIDSWMQGETIFEVCPPGPARTLRSWSNDHGPLAPRAIFRIGRDLCEVLAALHLFGRPAGPLTPRSILVDEGAREAYLLPPSVARPDGGGSRLLAGDDPEREGRELGDLGSLLFELLVGRRYRPDEDSAALRGGTLPPRGAPAPGTLGPADAGQTGDLVPEAYAVMRRLLLPAPAGGYPFAKRAHDDLSKVLAVLESDGDSAGRPHPPSQGHPHDPPMMPAWRTRASRAATITGAGGPTPPGPRGLPPWSLRCAAAVLAVALIVLKIVLPLPSAGVVP